MTIANTKYKIDQRQYGYMSSANRAIKNYEKKYGKQRFSIEKLDEGCFVVNLHQKKK